MNGLAPMSRSSAITKSSHGFNNRYFIKEEPECNIIYVGEITGLDNYTAGKV
jgi:hypothetical protein